MYGKISNTHDRPFSCPAVLRHHTFPGEVHAYAARIAPNAPDKDELTLAQAQKQELKHNLSLWLEATRKEMTSFIIGKKYLIP